jgi:uncharacterized membrane protein affecting hemolysin expression
LLSVLRKLFFWNYARNTWQWDVLCVVILIFIFLTPNSWFKNGERERAQEHQNSAISTVLIGAELVDNAEDKGRIEQLVRTMTNRPNVEVLKVRALAGNDGKPRSYEVDIR